MSEVSVVSEHSAGFSGVWHGLCSAPAQSNPTWRCGKAIQGFQKRWEDGISMCVTVPITESMGLTPCSPRGAGSGSVELLTQPKPGGCSSVEYEPSRVHVDKFFNKPCGYREAGFSLSHSCSNSLLEMEGRGNFQRSHVMARQTTTSKGSVEAKTGPSNNWQPVCR